MTIGPTPYILHFYHSIRSMYTLSIGILHPVGHTPATVHPLVKKLQSKHFKQGFYHFCKPLRTIVNESLNCLLARCNFSSNASPPILPVLFPIECSWWHFGIEQGILKITKMTQNRKIHFDLSHD